MAVTSSALNKEGSFQNTLFENPCLHFIERIHACIRIHDRCLYRSVVGPNRHIDSHIAPVLYDYQQVYTLHNITIIVWNYKVTEMSNHALSIAQILPKKHYYYVYPKELALYSGKTNLKTPLGQTITSLMSGNNPPHPRFTPTVYLIFIYLFPGLCVDCPYKAKDVAY